MAFNTCHVCNLSPKAYFVQITTDERIDEENTIIITKQFIESYKENF